ncbi:MAG: hypothetical protein KBF62_03215 [Candidatus Pacebacteria bacterium]|nr:hypothetical protein [Candidatus Paceibacterota bacterium]MBP9058621.1 hypothetical protein [Candidatus Paceibacterota bacterium]MBP9770372.1 hypothetical protein [Candidatus Paceibacterota bacterium]
MYNIYESVVSQTAQTRSVLRATITAVKYGKLLNQYITKTNALNLTIE